MEHERQLIEAQQQKALQTVNDITEERDRKGNAHVTAGRYGELVANMVRYAESQMALDLLNREGQQPSETASLFHEPDAQHLPSSQHVEPESLNGQNIVNPT